MLENLTLLSISSYESEFDIGLLLEMCPNLVKSKLDFNVKLGGCCKPWPKLQYLSITNHYLDPSKLQTFLKENLQITTLELFAGRE